MYYKRIVFGCDFGYPIALFADERGFIDAKGREQGKGAKAPTKQHFRIYFTDGSQYEFSGLTKKTRNNVIIEGIAAFLREYEGEKSVLLLIDSRPLVDLFCMPNIKKRCIAEAMEARALLKKRSKTIGITIMGSERLADNIIRYKEVKPKGSKAKSTSK